MKISNKNKRPLLSIVVPVYNAQRYLSEAIESVLNQSISDWELILVDDCSTDKSLSVIDRYVEADKRLKLIRRAVNSGGPRIPRFDGIQAARGSFIMYMDADDTIESQYIEKVLRRQKETNATIVTTRLILCSSCNEVKGEIPHSDFDFGDVLDGRDACKLTIGGWRISVSGALADSDYYKSFADECSQTDEHQCFVDEVDFRSFLLKAESVAFADAKYYYIQREGSVVHDVLKTSDRIYSVKKLFALVQNAFSEDESLLHAFSNDCVETGYRLYCRWLALRKTISADVACKIKQDLKDFYMWLRRMTKSKLTKKNRLLLSSWYMFVIITHMQGIYSKMKV